MLDRSMNRKNHYLLAGHFTASPKDSTTFVSPSPNKLLSNLFETRYMGAMNGEEVSSNSDNHRRSSSNDGGPVVGVGVATAERDAPRAEPPTEAWAQSLVSREWEIFWKHAYHQVAATTTTTTNSQSSGIANDATSPTKQLEQSNQPSPSQQSLSCSSDDVDEENEYEEDWYNARIDSIFPNAPSSTSESDSFAQQQSGISSSAVLCVVHFDGDDTMYEMMLDPTIVRPRQDYRYRHQHKEPPQRTRGGRRRPQPKRKRRTPQPQQQPPSLLNINTMKGKECEIFWKRNAPMKAVGTVLEEDDQGGDDDDDEQENRSNTSSSNNNDNNKEMEHVSPPTSSTACYQDSPHAGGVAINNEATQQREGGSPISIRECSSRRKKLKMENDGERVGCVPMDVDDPKVNCDNGDHEDDEGDEEDWYDATVVKYSGRFRDPSPTCDSSTSWQYFFRVCFAGDDDDTAYEMPLTPALVRPSARAWMKRTKAILDPQPELNRTRMLDDSLLPADTSTRGDQAQLELIEMQLDHELGDWTLAGVVDVMDRERGELLSSIAQDYPAMDRLLRLVRSQLYLRSRLAPIDESASEPQRDSSSSRHRRSSQPAQTAKQEGDFDPTEPYLDYLVERLRDVECSCVWYLQSSQWVGRMYATHAADNASDSPLSREAVVQRCIDKGRQVLTTMVTMDTSVAGSKRRRSTIGLSATSMPSSPAKSVPGSAVGTTPPRRTQRQRHRRQPHSQTDCPFWVVTDTGDRVWSDAWQDENFASTAMMDRLVDEAGKIDRRWYTHSCGRLVRALANLVILPLLRWELQVEHYLGERKELSLPGEEEDSSSTSSDEGSDDGDENEKKQGDDHSELGGRAHDDINRKAKNAGDRSNRKRKDAFVTYEVLSSFLDASSTDPILRNIDLKRLTGKLREKLSAIEGFENTALQAVQAVLDSIDASRGTSDMEITGNQGDSDAVLQTLEALFRQASAKTSLVFNVEPLGTENSILTRRVLSHATLYRKWYLDLNRAETVRERAVFVQDVVERSSNLPTLPLFLLKSKDGVTNRIDIAAKLEIIKPRIEALMSTCTNQHSILDRYKSSLQGDNLDNSLTSKESLELALTVVQKIPVISFIEEMLAIRYDAVSWNEDAHPILSKERPPFAEVIRLKETLDLVMDGQSQTRRKLLAETRPNNSIDEEIRRFARSDMAKLFGSSVDRINDLVSRSSSWNDRADAVLSVLRAFGNLNAGEPALGQKQPPAMIDLKRVEDLLIDYKDLQVDVSDVHDRLKRVHKESMEWASSISDYLLDDHHTFQECLARVEAFGKIRPRGIIVHPTRQIIDVLVELLQWYSQVKKAAAVLAHSREAVLALLADGIRVVGLYNSKRLRPCTFFDVSHVVEILPRHGGPRRMGKGLQFEKIEAHSLCQAVLDRMTEQDRDEKEGHAMFFLLSASWYVYAAEFVCQSCGEGVSSSSIVLSLKAAKELRSQRPVPVHDPPAGTLVSWAEAGELDKLIQDGDQAEEEARNSLLQSKPLFRESFRRLDALREHHSKLKSILAGMKSRDANKAGVSLDAILEQQVDQDIKLFAWLNRAIQYPILRCVSDEAAKELEKSTAEDCRVPWDILVSLHDKLPQAVPEIGDFACIVLRVRELYHAASSWQNEISELTKLSLRGGKRRSPGGNAATVKSEDNEEEESKINIEKVMQLSSNPVLYQVSMPRENGIRSMLESTKQFEIMLMDFLGCDYDGPQPDKAAFPTSNSLLGSDGSFLLYRLTGSPLFGQLKSSIVSIAQVAEGVFAETPGKATFDWIRRAVQWIESIQSAVKLGSTPLREAGEPKKLSIVGSDAKSILITAQKILLDVPDDLRKTLSQHGISVIPTRDGKLTVKSKKGGSHYAVGVTAIRWCPFLFNALKADVETLDAWEKRVRDVSSAFLEFHKATSGANAKDHAKVQGFYRFRQELNDIVEDGAELVLLPPQTLIESVMKLYSNIQSFLRANSSVAAAKHFVDEQFRNRDVIVNNRFDLLDSLVARVAISTDEGVDWLDRDDDTSNNTPFRTAGRTLMERALWKGSQALGVGFREATKSLCAVRAWEIESALFELYQGEHGESKITPEYRDKARALRRSLEDLHNLSLCAQVMSGGLDAGSIVVMTTEQLANQRLKQERAKAVAKNNIVLTGEVKVPGMQTRSSTNRALDASLDGTTNSDNNLFKFSPSPPAAAAARASISFPPSMLPIPCSAVEGLPNSTVLKPSAPAAPTNGIGSPLTFPNAIQPSTATVPIPGDSAGAEAMSNGSNANDSARLKPPPSLTNYMRSASRAIAAAAPAATDPISKPIGSSAGPPPPPPSLVNALRSSSRPPVPASAVMNASGSDRFHLTLNNGRTQVTVSFVPEHGTAVEEVNHSIPEQLLEQGRLGIPEFTKFVRGKLETGRWKALVLRLRTVTDQDAAAYKTYTKEYEMRQRISMFGLDSGKIGKIFLVTPRFHRDAAHRTTLTFSKPSSSYAVILAKRT